MEIVLSIRSVDFGSQPVISMGNATSLITWKRYYTSAVLLLLSECCPIRFNVQLGWDELYGFVHLENIILLAFGTVVRPRFHTLLFRRDLQLKWALPSLLIRAKCVPPVKAIT
ncbi:hypothetical protein SDJN02_03137, partial [Cucurbita argyrosperma subsp. argyrosperma]